MARNERKRQKALQRKRHKEKARRRAASVLPATPRSVSGNVEVMIRNARSYPIQECWINPSWQETGLANILLARGQPDGCITFGCYLVDIQCLGLKSTFCNANFAPAHYAQTVRKPYYVHEAAGACPPPLAHAIIYGGIDYAAALGFAPDRDFRLSQFVLDPRDAFDRLPHVEFGRDGKPLFVSGPRDNVAAILAKLERRLGEGNYHYIAGGPIG